MVNHTTVKTVVWIQQQTYFVNDLSCEVSK